MKIHTRHLYLCLVEVLANEWCTQRLVCIVLFFCRVPLSMFSVAVPAMYDHYCGVLGTPIGEKNHARFWWYLCIQTMSLCYAIGIVHSGFRNSIYTDWYNDNAHQLWSVLFLYILTAFVGSLWVFHTWLACTNMTSYEFMRAKRK